MSNKPTPRPRTIRCAIYTRKSTEEGLDQQYNSLDSQRDAGEAYIRSQANEGWELVLDRYDDGGFSGGNIERPALKRLMEDIQAGKIDCVVVYKVDRLSRSLLDFARVMETFDKFSVSFVSVTQHFNTTHSMGRLTLNILLSFAQFEREIIGERIRDKLAAQCRRGQWTGGYLRTRGLEVKEPNRIDNAAIEKLVDVLINPTMKTPQGLLNAVYYFEEMSTPLAADSLLTRAQQAGMPFDENGKHSLADIVMQVWLFDSKMVEAQHAWQTWKTPRRMECFQPVQSTGIAPITITEDRLKLAIKDAGDWFAKHNRGHKVFMTPRIVDDEIQIAIRRGDPYNRKPTIDDDGMDTVTFREAKKDSMIYDLSEEVLMLNSSLKSSYPVYSRIFGKLLFDDPEYFGIFNRYTLAPLSELGEDALSPGELDAIEEIVLLNYRVWLGGPFNRYIIHGADDFFADLKWRGGVFQEEGPLDRANFRIKYRDVKARRNLTLYTGCSSSYTRDEYSRHIEDWLLLRRFVMKTGARAEKGVNKDDQAVASY